MTTEICRNNTVKLQHLGIVKKKIQHQQIRDKHPTVNVVLYGKILEMFS